MRNKMKQYYIKTEHGYKPVKEFTGFPSNGVWLVEDGSQSLIHKLDYKTMPPFLPALMGKEEEAHRYVIDKLTEVYSRHDVIAATVEFYASLITENKYPEAFL